MAEITNHQRVIFEALKLSSNKPEANYFDRRDGVYGDAHHFYASYTKKVLSQIPWSFASLNPTCSYSRRLEGEDYAYEFDLPEDVRFLWDIYVKEDARLSYTHFVDNPYQYVNVQSGKTPGNFGDYGAIINGRIRSNYDRISLLYTRKGTFGDDQLSEPFLDILTNMMVEALQKTKGVSVERLQHFEEVTEKSRSRGLRMGSVENHGGERLPDTRLVARLRRRY